ncbi:MAG: 16S rRNA (cytosine(1402)-N(4))-methyltransferase [Candidatus Nealsonbacteria bacterium]|nr:16S rRNA (cytosine(1402)-N(4))-methyltransferase [Candidatus Nealsonbacteria bacterium]
MYNWPVNEKKLKKEDPRVMSSENRVIVRLLTKKPVMAGSSEIKKNPKSDRAKLRAVEKLSICHYDY